MSTYKAWTCTSIASGVFLVHFAPGYSLGRSYTWTAVALFLLQWLVYGIYSVILYPRFFSPLRHLPSPPVSGSLPRSTRSLKPSSGGFILYGTLFKDLG